MKSKENEYKATELKLDGSENLEKYNLVALIENDGTYSVGKTSDLAKDFCESRKIKIYVTADEHLNHLRAFTENDAKGDFYGNSGCAISLEHIYTMYFLERIMTAGENADYKVYGLIHEGNSCLKEYGDNWTITEAELGKKYLAEHEPEIKIIYDGDNVPTLAIKSNRQSINYFTPDMSSIYAQVYNYFVNSATPKQHALNLAEFLEQKAEQLRAAVRTLDKNENIQAVITGCLDSLRSLSA